ncbi:MAG: serine/threonine protein kinase, partial [Gammaproteobacteria bacterium]
METHHTPGMKPATAPAVELKRDALGTIRHDTHCGCVIRETADAAPWTRSLARRLARREARALRQLAGSISCPRLITETPGRVVRSYLPGNPLHCARFDARSYFRDALRQLRRMHAHGIAHNDLAKEANWICMPGDCAGIVDFQIAC